MALSVEDAAAQHVVRTLRALELLAEGPHTQADLARHLVVHRRTARRLLARLVDEGYAEVTRRGRQVTYAATPRLVVLGRRVADRLDLVEIGRKHLASLAEAGTAPRFIALPTADGVWLAHVDEPPSAEADAVTARIARNGPLHATAAGKVFLSADTTLLNEVLNQELLAFTGGTLVTRADLLLELASVRAQGFAVEDGEHRSGARAVASGVRDHAGDVVAAIGMALPEGGDVSALGALVRNAAQEFSAEIGGVGLEEAPEAEVLATNG